jgi:uncharacterized membrane protein YfcA
VPLTTLLLSLAILTVAGFTQGLTGFGFGLVSMALLPLLLPVKEAAVVVAVLNLVTCVFTLWAVRRHLCWRRGRSLIVGSAAGVPFGVYLLAHLEPAPLLRAMGIVLVGFAAAELLTDARSRPRVPGWLGLPAGFLGGSIGGALNMGGPPVIAYVYAQPWSKEEIVATLQLVFGVSALLRVALIGAGGLYTAPMVPLLLLTLAPMALAILLGTRLLLRVPLVPLRRGVAVFLLALGLKHALFP